MAKKDVDEILSKVKGFEADYSSVLSNLNKGYELASGRHKRRRTSAYTADSTDPELFTQIEVLATAFQDMVFSDDTSAAFWDAYGTNEGDHAAAMVTKQVMTHQLGLLEFNTRTMSVFRNLCRDGVRVVELPWVFGMKTTYAGKGSQRRRVPAFDSFGFNEVETLRFGHSGASRLSENSWVYDLRAMNRYQAKSMERNGDWKNVERALERKDSGSKPSYVSDRERLVGLPEEPKNREGFEAVYYCGELESRDDGEIYKSIISRNGLELVAPVINPYDHGEFPYEDVRLFDRGDSFYGLGLAALLGPAQVEITDRLNMINDMLLQYLFNMWMRGPEAGIGSDDMRWSPNRIIDVDRMDQLTPIRPDLGGLRHVMDMQTERKQGMRRASGATETLQAIISKATATESSIAQNEAVRRAKVQVKTSISNFLRRCLYKWHALNMQFLDPGLFMRITDKKKFDVYKRWSNRDLVLHPDIQMKIATDNDFRGVKREALGQFIVGMPKLMEVLQMAPGKQVRLKAETFLREYARLYDIDPDEAYEEVLVANAQSQLGFGGEVANSLVGESEVASQLMDEGGALPDLDAMLRAAPTRPI